MFVFILQQEFTWDSVLTTTVKNAFHQKAARHYTKRINEWKQKWELDQVPKHLNPVVGQDLIDHCGKNDTKSLSETNSTNRCSLRGGKGIFVHNLGATSLQT